ncbi:hypothetical protein QYF36_004623 [Acer negundo]|nr:hypothetical protein QYF36_003889 [Acer negundo]KAK4837330.1 hypothetical protein QYF36_004623 [Acer negundo]
MTRLKLRFPVSSTFSSRFNSYYNSAAREEPLTETELKTLVLSNCSHGHFPNLIQNVVALPSVLLTASLSMSNHSPSMSNHFSFQEMGQQIFENRFDIQSCSVDMSSGKGESFVLPNLKLKVLIEAIRLVLEIVYDERFATFSYGGRVNMGRHTAIRYLKNSEENPSWWFVVSFNRQEFDERNVDKLCLFMGEKIKDTVLIDLLKRLFDFKIMRIELGCCYLGRGLPQECGLCSILINIYFNGFDRELQEMRLKIYEKNPKFDSNELCSKSNVYYKPLKIYAIRYLDEILVITSGSKTLTMDLKTRVLKFLEENLELNVDRVKMAIHSAVSGKIDFLGMELQAVPPSVLHPPMSEKAVRARKKYLRQKEVRALELRNVWERNRKKLGSKILNHVFKKQSNVFKFEFQIENEVRDIFKTWADEVVQEFLGSLEERWSWHRMLSRGDFLSLRHVGDQMPEELVDAYDKFQEQPEEAKLISELSEKDAIKYGLFKQAYDASFDKFLDEYVMSKFHYGLYDIEGACVNIIAGSKGIFLEILIEYAFQLFCFPLVLFIMVGKDSFATELHLTNVPALLISSSKSVNAFTEHDSPIWEEQLLRMYTNWAEKRGCRGRLFEKCCGKNCGINS